MKNAMSNGKGKRVAEDPYRVPGPHVPQGRNAETPAERRARLRRIRSK